MKLIIAKPPCEHCIKKNGIHCEPHNINAMLKTCQAIETAVVEHGTEELINKLYIPCINFVNDNQKL